MQYHELAVSYPTARHVGELVGWMNVVESSARIGDDRVPLLGGEAACVFVYPGSYDVFVTSTNPWVLRGTRLVAGEMDALPLK